MPVTTVASATACDRLYQASTSSGIEIINNTQPMAPCTMLAPNTMSPANISGTTPPMRLRSATRSVTQTSAMDKDFISKITYFCDS